MVTVERHTAVFRYFFNKCWGPFTVWLKFLMKDFWKKNQICVGIWQISLLCHIALGEKFNIRVDESWSTRNSLWRYMLMAPISFNLHKMLDLSSNNLLFLSLKFNRQFRSITVTSLATISNLLLTNDKQAAIQQ